MDVTQNVPLNIAIVLFLGILGGRLIAKIKIPEVTGYFLVGIVVGPSVCNILSQESIEPLRVISEIALGLILFSIGGEICFDRFKKIGRKILPVVLSEGFGTFTVVLVTIFFIAGTIMTKHEAANMSVLLASIAIATAPAATLLVLREYHSKGILTEYILAVVALNNLLCLIVFRLALLGVKFFMPIDPNDASLLTAALLSLWEIAGSILLGGIIGGILSFWAQKEENFSELVMIMGGALLLGIGCARALNLSPLLTAMSMGCIIANFSPMKKEIFTAIKHTDPPLYVSFFVLSGAELDMGALKFIGIIGVGYVLSRIAGKIIGAYVGANLVHASKPIKKYLGISLIPQAGVALGLALALKWIHLPGEDGMGAKILTIILASVIIYEIIGPIFTRFAIVKAGEAQTKTYVSKAKWI
ncbi:MAG: cation:proton antiporter [Armatimonadota bacterium]